MLYLGIDQHARQITISLRDEGGDVVQARQVSTQPEKVHAFFQPLTRERLTAGASFVAVLEVCGLNDWLIGMLHEYRCHKVILIQPDDRKKCKTGRRDAAGLSELLWVNRERLLQGKPVRGLRQVDIARSTDQENRRLTTLRKDAGQARTRLVNQVRHILRRHNLQWQMPTKRFPTKAAIAWLKQLALPEIDRLEMDHLLADLEQVQGRRQDAGAGDRPALRRQRGGDAPGLDAGGELLHRRRAGVPGRAGRALPAGAQPGQLLGPHPRLPQQRRAQPATGQHHQGGQQHGAVAAGGGDHQGAAPGRPAAGVVQAPQEAAGGEHRPGRGDAEAGHGHLAHAEQADDLRRVPGCRRGGDESKAGAGVRKGVGQGAPRGGFSAWVPIPNGRGRHRAAPFGVGP